MTLRHRLSLSPLCAFFNTAALQWMCSVCTEPLSGESALWGMENMLLSAHNAYLTATFLRESARLFVDNMANSWLERKSPFTLSTRRRGIDFCDVCDAFRRYVVSFTCLNHQAPNKKVDARRLHWCVGETMKRRPCARSAHPVGAIRDTTFR